jgi:hypothetical protein
VDGHQIPGLEGLLWEILEVEGEDGLGPTPVSGGHHVAVMGIGQVNFRDQMFVPFYEGFLEGERLGHQVRGPPQALPLLLVQISPSL